MSTESQPYSDSNVTASVQSDNTDTDTAEAKRATLTAAISVGCVQRFLDAIRTINDEFELVVTPNGVIGTVVNTSQTMMGSVRLDASAFENYEAMTGEVGIQTDRLAALNH